MRKGKAVGKMIALINRKQNIFAAFRSRRRVNDDDDDDNDGVVVLKGQNLIRY